VWGPSSGTDIVHRPEEMECTGTGLPLLNAAWIAALSADKKSEECRYQGFQNGFRLSVIALSSSSPMSFMR
jgi:hypothetical protein